MGKIIIWPKGLIRIRSDFGLSLIMSVSTTTTTTTTTSSEDKTGNPGLVSTSDALIAFSDHILEQIDGLQKLNIIRKVESIDL